MTFKLKQKILKVFVHLQCTFLFVRNLILVRKLSFKHFSHVSTLVIQGNKAELIWIVSGCHKIFVKGFGVIPGNTSGISFTPQTQQNSLEITFFGIGRKETKDLRVEATSIELTNKFISKTITPQLISTPLAHQKLTSVFGNSFQLTESENIIIDIRTPKTTPVNLNIQHEPFIRPNYLT